MTGASVELVYIAGPFSASTSAGIFRNTAAAVAFGQEVRALGLVPMVPHVAILPTDTTPDAYEAAMRECFEILSRCDALVLMPSWRQSPGAVRECERAEALGLEVFESLEALKGAARAIA